MRAVEWHGKRDLRVDQVPDPAIEDPTETIARVTTIGVCGWDLGETFRKKHVGAVRILLYH